MRTKIILTTTLLAALLAAVAVAQPGRRGGPWHRGGLPWETLAADYDQNQDGQITLEEFGGAKGTFEHFDRDGDGVLTEADFPSRARMRQHFGGFLVLAADADDDGAVTTAEWQSFLAELDADADGLISEDELRSTFKRPDGARGDRPRRPRPWAEGDHPLDRDGDGAVEVEDFNLIFAALDADGDGTVTDDEVQMRRLHRRGRF
ncbi:MAG TPA: EF-hand domain-containing protein [Thermoanaerobaculia bacterium]